jgi:lysozyme
MYKAILFLVLSFVAQSNLLICKDRVKHLASREGFRSQPYKDITGHWTIGYGHKFNTPELPTFSRGISREEGLNLLKADIIKHDKYARAIYASLTLNCTQKNAIKDMVFQLGYVGTLKFKNMLSCLKKEDYKCAAKAVRNSLWYKQTPIRVEDFMKRIQHG